MRQCPNDHIGAHFEGFASFFGRIFVDVGIVPAVGNVAAHIVKDDQAAFVKQPQSLRGFAIVFVDFWQAVWKAKRRLKEAKRRGQWDELFVRECALEFSAKGFVQPVVVVGKEKSPALEVQAQAAQFFFGESDVPVAREEQHGIGEEVVVCQRDLGFLVRGANGRVLRDKCEQIGDFRRAVVPIATAVVLEAGDGKCRDRFSQLRRAGRGEHEDENEKMAHGF